MSLANFVAETGISYVGDAKRKGSIIAQFQNAIMVIMN